MAFKENKKTVRRFRDAIDVQNACNPSGIAYSMYEHYKAMLDAGASTYELQTDPAMSFFIAELALLAGVLISPSRLEDKALLLKKQVTYYEANPPSE
jgi:hypothetical protein